MNISAARPTLVCPCVGIHMVGLLVLCYGISILVYYLMSGFSLLVFMAYQCRIYNVKSSLYIYIRYIGFGFVGFYGISTIVGYLMPNPLYKYISYLIWLSLWHISRCWLFSAKSFLYIYIKYIWFGLVGFYGISTLVGYLMPNLFSTYMY